MQRSASLVAELQEDLSQKDLNNDYPVKQRADHLSQEHGRSGIHVTSGRYIVLVSLCFDSCWVSMISS